jgi:hypothetical protein
MMSKIEFKKINGANGLIKGIKGYHIHFSSSLPTCSVSKRRAPRRGFVPHAQAEYGRHAEFFCRVRRRRNNGS